MMNGLFIVFLACAPPRDPAPEDLEGLASYLYANWEDPISVADGMANMAVWLETEGQEEKAQEEGYMLAPLAPEVLEGITYPTRLPLEEMAGAAVTRNSIYSIDLHAAVIVEADQRWNAASKYEIYDRVLTEGSDTSFLAEDAADVPQHIFTDNDIAQERLGIRIPYNLLKNYRWTQTESGNRAIIARSWIPSYGCSSDDGEGGNCVELSFSVDLFYENDDNTTTRMTASWNAVSLIIDMPFDFQVDQLVNGMIDVDDDTDAHIKDTFGL